MRADRTAVVREIVDLLGELEDIHGMPSSEIHEETRLVETLELTSVDIMHLLASVEMRFERPFPFDELVMVEDRYVSDLSVGRITDFVLASIETGTTRHPRPMA